MKAIRTIAICTTLLMIGSACMAAGLVRGGKAPQRPAKSGEVNAEWWGPGPGRPGQDLVVHGAVLQVDASSIQVQTVARGTMQFAVTDKTRVIVGGKPGGIADVQKGDTVNLKFKPVPNGTPIAVGIQVVKNPEPGKGRLRGKVAAVESNVVTVHSPKGDVKVTVAADTKIMSRCYQGSIADLKVGYEIVVAGDPASPKKIEFFPMTGKGAVADVKTDQGVTYITVKLVRQKTIDLVASAATVVLIRPRVGPNVPGTLADVKVGAPVNIGFHANPGAACPLLWIEVLTGM